MSARHCVRCGEMKPETDFRLTYKWRYNTCRLCQNAERMERYYATKTTPPAPERTRDPAYQNELDAYLKRRRTV